MPGPTVPVRLLIGRKAGIALPSLTNLASLQEADRVGRFEQYSLGRATGWPCFIRQSEITSSGVSEWYKHTYQALRPGPVCHNLVTICYPRFCSNGVVLQYGNQSTGSSARFLGHVLCNSVQVLAQYWNSCIAPDSCIYCQ